MNMNQMVWLETGGLNVNQIENLKAESNPVRNRELNQGKQGGSNQAKHSGKNQISHGGQHRTSGVNDGASFR